MNNENEITVTYPNGRTQKFAGDTQPSEQDVMELFQKMHPKEFDLYSQQQLGKGDVDASGIKADVRPDVDEGALAYLFLEGLSFNMSDEALSFLDAGWQSLTTDVPFEDAYEGNRDAYQARIKAARLNNPVATTSSEIGGAFANPLNFVGKLKGLGLAARAAGEGALAGFGSGEGNPLDRLGSTAQGTIYGVAGHGVASAAGKTFDRFTKTKLEDISGGERGDIPLSLAQESNPLGDTSLATRLYRDFIAPSQGGGNLVRDEKVYLKSLDDNIYNQNQAFTDMQRQNTDLLNEAKKQLAIAQEKAKAELDIEMKNIDFKNADTEELLKAPYVALNSQVKEGELMSFAAREIRENIQLQQDLFKAEAMLSSTPAYMRSSGVDEMNAFKTAATPQQQLAILDDAWVRYGFGSIKSQDFLVDPDSLVKGIKNAVKDTPEIKLMLGDGVLDNTLKRYANLIKENTNGGVLSGDYMSTLRSSLASMKNTGIDVTPKQRAENIVLDQLGESIDNIVTSQLKGDALKAYKVDMDAWKHNKVLRQTIRNNSKGGEIGNFTAKDWVDASLQVSPRTTSRGKSVLQDRANQLVEDTKRADDFVKKQADSLTAKITKNQDAALKNSKRQATIDKMKLEAEKKRAIKNMKEDPDIMQTVAQKQMEIDKTSAFIKEQENYFKSMAKLSSIDSSWFQTFASTQTLGDDFSKFIPDGFRTKTMKFLLGSLAGKTLSKRSVQKFAAKQTDTQKFLQESSQAFRNAPVPISALAGGATTVGEGMLRVPAILGRTMVEDAQQEP